MKKIIFSLSIVVAVAAVVVGATTAYFSDTETSNGNTFTAGSLDLIVDLNGTDENPFTQKIFNLSDMKPGDSGEQTISLRVDDNPACGFVDIDMTSDNENTCTEPEIVDETGCVSNGLGELNDEVQFVIFSDPDCDNRFEVDRSKILTEGTLTSSRKYAIGELPTENKECYGIAYCFGNPQMTSSLDGDDHAGIVCDGEKVNNQSQSDSFTGDLLITAKQKRAQFEEGGCPTGDITNQ